MWCKHSEVLNVAWLVYWQTGESSVFIVSVRVFTRDYMLNIVQCLQLNMFLLVLLWRSDETSRSTVFLLCVGRLKVTLLYSIWNTGLKVFGEGFLLYWWCLE